jgi:hypothetical protein
MSREELVRLLDDIRDRVAAGDSLDGELRFRHTGCRADVDHYDVTAIYRVGRLVQMIGIPKAAS